MRTNSTSDFFTLLFLTFKRLSVAGISSLHEYSLPLNKAGIDLIPIPSIGLNWFYLCFYPAFGRICSRQSYHLGIRIAADRGCFSLLPFQQWRIHYHGKWDREKITPTTSLLLSTGQTMITLPADQTVGNELNVSTFLWLLHVEFFFSSSPSYSNASWSWWLFSDKNMRLLNVFFVCFSS